MQQINVFFLHFWEGKTAFFLYFGLCVCVRVCVRVLVQEMVRQQLSPNKFHCCGITDNPGRFDSKSTQVT